MLHLHRQRWNMQNRWPRKVKWSMSLFPMTWRTGFCRSISFNPRFQISKRLEASRFCRPFGSCVHMAHNFRKLLLGNSSFLRKIKAFPSHLPEISPQNHITSESYFPDSPFWTVSSTVSRTAFSAEFLARVFALSSVSFTLSEMQLCRESWTFRIFSSAPERLRMCV